MTRLTFLPMLATINKRSCNMNKENEQAFKEKANSNKSRPWGVALSVWENFALPKNVDEMPDDEYENMIKWL